MLQKDGKECQLFGALKMSKTIMKDKTRIPTLSIDFEQYDSNNIDVWETYIPIKDEKKRLTMALMSANIPYLIESEKGQGKTLLIHTICKENGIALVNEPIGIGTKKSDLIGSKEINRDGTFFSLGLLPKAIEVANHFGHACLYGDEGSNQEHEVQQLWHSICDGRRSIIANGKQYKLNKGCKLAIIWTINPVTYAGVNSMTEALRSRFIGSAWNYPTNAETESVIDWTDIAVDAVKTPLLTLAQDIYALKLKGDVEYALSIRDIVQFTHHFREIQDEIVKPLETTLSEVIMIKFSEPSERELIRLRIEDTFDVKL
jgi:MoxR-like ATPase